MINTDGTGLKRVTAGETFDAFPVFSNNGKYLAFSITIFPTLMILNILQVSIKVNL